MKFFVALPLIFSMAAFVLTMLALFAGYKQDFMEDYSIMVFNTSTLGQNWLQNEASGRGSSSTTSSTASTTPTPTDSSGFNPGGFFSSIEASATAAVESLESAAADALNDIGNDIAGKLSQELGIEQFYSLHIMDLCEGDYSPNATAGGAWRNVTNCTRPMDFSAMDLSTLLDQQLSIGPFNISLSDLGITQKIQDKLNDLPALFEAMAAIYIISACFTGLAILGSLAGFFLVPQSGRKIVLLNVCLAVPAALFLFIGSLIYTVGGREAIKKIHDLGAGDVGLEVSIGSGFLALTWAAFALMFIAAGYWVYELVAMTRASKRTRRSRRGKIEKGSMDSYRGY